MDINPLSAYVQPCEVNGMAAPHGFECVWCVCTDGIIRRLGFFVEDASTGLKHACVLSSWAVDKDKNIVKFGAPEPNMAPRHGCLVIPTCIDSHHLGLWGIVGFENGKTALVTLSTDEGMVHHMFPCSEKNLPISCIAINAAEDAFISGGYDRCVALWELDHGKLVRRFSGHPSQLSSICWRPGDSFVFASSSISGSMTLWDIRQELPIKRIVENGFGWLRSASWGPTGTEIYSGYRDGYMGILDITSGLQRRVLIGKNVGQITQVRCAGSYVICVSFDKMRYGSVYELQSQSATFYDIPGHENGTISDLLVSYEKRCIVSSSGCKGLGGKPNNRTVFYEIRKSS